MKIKVKMKPDGNTLARPFQKNYDPVVDEELASLANQVNENIRAEAPKKSGRLRAGHRVVKRGAMRYELEIDPKIKYAGPVRYGTGPRIIKPRVKKVLAWSGARHPVKMVRHPGNRPNDWPERGIQKSKGDIARAEERIADKIEDSILKT